MVLVHVLSWTKLYIILKLELQEIEGPRILLPLFEGKHLEHMWISLRAPISPKDKPLTSHMVG